MATTRQPWQPPPHPNVPPARAGVREYDPRLAVQTGGYGPPAGGPGYDPRSAVPPAHQPLAPRPDSAPPPRGLLRSIGAFCKRWTIPIIGGITPVGLILVNVAVWMNDHLQTLRWIIAVAAFLSGMILNTWWVLQAYRWIQQRWPHWGLVHERNQEMVLVAGMAGVTIFSFLSALFCFVGLGDTRRLPNAPTFYYGAFQIVLPFAAKVYFEYAEGRAKRRNRAGALGAGDAGASGRRRPAAGAAPGPPVPPSFQPPVRGVVPPPPPAGGGYTPPGYLPPS